ncbi:YihY/virulence factor BrkB family protein [Bdellovibrio bacteriovorus]|nr:YihY/virulence factor BrkB family protein [Bdellovibrio bacteriovorus]
MKDLLPRLTSQEFIDKLEKDKVFDLSASLAYYTALSVAPLLVLTLASVALLGDGLKSELIQQVHALIGGQAAETITSIAVNADISPHISGWAGIMGLGTLFFSAGAIFGQLRTSLNTIFESANTPDDKELSWLLASWDFLKQKIFNMGMVLSFVFISLVSLLISSLISLLLRGPAAILGQFANLISSQIVFSLLFAGIYYFLPQKKISKRIALVAGAFTALFFSIGKSLIGFYLGKSAIVSLWGAAGSLIILLMWVYYSSLIIFLSAEVANELNKLHQSSRPL